MLRHIARRPLLAGLAGLGLASPALAQSGAAPRPITIIVPFAPGGSTDIVSRLLAERMTSLLGQPVQVENRAGANTIIGAEFVARARPDGHTLLMAAGTTLTINPVIVPNLPYKLEDFAPDYLALVVAETLEPITSFDRAATLRLLAAARLGSVRLLDNMPVPA